MADPLGSPITPPRPQIGGMCKPVSRSQHPEAERGKAIKHYLKQAGSQLGTDFKKNKKKGEKGMTMLRTKRTKELEMKNYAVKMSCKYLI